MKSSAVVAGTTGYASDVNAIRTDALNLRALADSTKTISGGVITVTADYSYYVVAAESGTTDDLDTVTAGSGIAVGDMVMLMADAGDAIQFTVAGNLDRKGYITEENAVVIRYNGSGWDVVQHSRCGWRKLSLPVAAMSPADTNGCGAVQRLSSGWIVRAFDKDTAEYCSINLTPPAGWSGIAKCRLRWTVNDANSGNVRWRWRMAAAADGEVLDSVTNELIELDAAPGTAQKMTVTGFSTAITRADGDTVLIDLYRDAANAGDTYGADAYGIEMEMYFLMYGDGVQEI